MNRLKFRGLMLISAVCLFSAMMLHHSDKQQVDLEDFLKGMGTTILVGSMALMVGKQSIGRARS